LNGAGDGNNGENGKGNPPPPGPLIVDIKGGYSADQRAKEKDKEYAIAGRIARWTMITGIGTGIAALLAGVAAVIFWNQLGTMQAQLNAQEADFKLDQRPILDLSDVAPADHLDGLHLDPMNDLIWNYTIKNFGKGTAISSLVCTYYSVLGGDFVTQPHGGAVDIGPSKGIWGTVTLVKSVTPDFVKQIEGTADGVIIKFVFEYKDVSGSRYENSFCLGRNIGGTIGVSTCPPSQIGKRAPPDGTCEKDYK